MNLNANGELGQVPSIEELQEASQYRGWEYIEIDEEHQLLILQILMFH